MGNAIKYGTAWRHVYPGGCINDGRYLTRSEVGTSRGWEVHKGHGCALYRVRVTFALVAWRGDGRYRLEDAIATYPTEARADADAAARYAADSASHYVVRAFLDLSETVAG